MVSASGRAAMRLPSDANDVVFLTKRFASDQFLIQDHIDSENLSVLEPTQLCAASLSVSWMLGAGIGFPKVLPPKTAYTSTCCAEHCSAETGQA